MDGQGVVVAGNRSVSRDPVVSLMPEGAARAVEAALMMGDLKGLSTEHRIAFYNAVCDSVGLNPLTRPLEYIVLNNKLTMYARKDATDQLRKIHSVSVEILGRDVVDGSYVVRARASMADGRQDESIGAVDLGNLKGQERANAMMKAETKAKRRVTLSICGLGYLDESELEDRPRPKMRYLKTEDVEVVVPGNPPAAVGDGQELKGPDPQAAGDFFDDDDIQEIRKHCAKSSFNFDRVIASLAEKGITDWSKVLKADKQKLLDWISAKASAAKRGVA